jgi:hypothetical protein
MGLFDSWFGLGRWMADHDHGLVRLEPEFTVGAVESARNQLNQSIHRIDLRDRFPGIGGVFAGAEAVVNNVADPDLASGDGDPGGHDQFSPEPSAARLRTLFRETLIKSKFVIPAKAGIRPKEVQSQEIQRTGHRPSPV